MSSLIELSGLFTELKGSLELPKTPTHVAPDLAVCLHMSQLDLTLLGGFLLSFCPLFSMFELTLWGSRNSVAGRAVHHSLQTGVGRQEKEPLRCMHPLGVFLTSQHMNNTCHWDMLIFPAQALAWSQHTLPTASSCTSFTPHITALRPWIPPGKVCLESPLHWCCEKTALHASRDILARTRIRICTEPSQGTTL